MCYKLCLLILPVLGLATLWPVSKCEKVVGYELTSSGCDPPFENVNNGCYYFSDVQMDFDYVYEYCLNLANDQVHEITLAMLCYEVDQDQSLLNAMAAKNKTFWLGGISDNGDQWQWIDGRDIYITAPFWDLNEPNQVENTCMAAETGSVTAHEDVAQSKIFDHNCSDILPFVCQTNSIKCPPDFILIENFCYLHSKTFGAPNLHWQDARDYCQSLDVYEGYHADLAVLGL
ncbi:unnamed protein product [Meganyctiphanes norvegica]|uniref:C-type lectin domain-containing protein n=1 Tax=Meganyctiphanes norvegica TaxID=48144 RepID=A0AAV2SKW0_MEGNR